MIEFDKCWSVGSGALEQLLDFNLVVTFVRFGTQELDIQSGTRYTIRN